MAQDEWAQLQLAELAQFTDADVAASSNPTGGAGDWVLEHQYGEIETTTIAPDSWNGSLWLAEALQASWFSDNASNRNLVTVASPSSLTFSNLSAGPGVGLGAYTFGGATTFAIAGVDSTSYAQSISTNEYIKSSFTINSGLTNGFKLSTLKFRAYSSPASAYLSAELYDTTTGTLSTLTPMNISLSSSTAGSLIWSISLNTVPVISGRTYELRFYVWGGGSYKTVYIDNPLIYARENEMPVARADTFTATAGTAVSGNLVTANNGSGADSDPEGQTLSVSKINGAAYTVGANISLSKGTLRITNADGGFTFTPTVGTTGIQTFTYTISDGVGGTIFCRSNLLRSR